MRLKRCGLKGIALLHFILHKHLMHIQAVRVVVMQNTTEYVAALIIVFYWVCKVMVSVVVNNNPRARQAFSKRPFLLAIS